MSKPDSGHFKGTRGAQRVEYRRVIDSLPKNPDRLRERGWTETSHPDAAKFGHRTFHDPILGLTVRFDKGSSGFSRHKARDHYHVLNPDRTGKMDMYLDKDGSPVPKGSEESHLYPKGRG
ncbi:MAG: hypothetical protein Q4D38_01450 [Planctomycetia bacterium]|nr:hypothetical protein [Planctomycetia bacterium]